MRILADTYHLNNTKEDLRKTCQQFEALFCSHLLKVMRDSIPKSGFLEQGFAFQVAQSMYDEVLSEELSKTGCLGIADELYNQLSTYVDEQ